MRLSIKCPKSSCSDKPREWDWKECSHPVFLSDEADVRRLLNTFSCGAMPAISTTLLQTLVLNVIAGGMVQTIPNMMCATSRLHCKEGLIQLTAVED